MYILSDLGYDTKAFEDNVVRPLQAQLPKEILNQISWRIIGQAKPWHLTAHKIIQAVNLVRDTKGHEQALTVFRYFVDNIPEWDNTALNTKSVAAYMDALAEKVALLSGISKSVILPQLAHYSDYDKKAREEFKFGISSRHSGLNPTIFVNGAKIDDGLNQDLNWWKKLINDLVN